MVGGVSFNPVINLVEPSDASSLRASPAGLMWLNRTPCGRTVSGEGSGDRRDPERALHNHCGPIFGVSKGWDGPALVQALGKGDQLLPGASFIRGGPHTRPVVGFLHRGRPGQNVAYLVLSILCPSQPLLYQPTYLCLLGRAACQGPPPGG